jgi:hypothetical protein
MPEESPHPERGILLSDPLRLTETCPGSPAVWAGSFTRLFSRPRISAGYDRGNPGDPLAENPNGFVQPPTTLRPKSWVKVTG